MLERSSAYEHSFRLVPAVDRAARILDVLRRDGQRGISDLARLLRMNKGTVREILETLRFHGFVERDDGSKRYRLGPTVASLAASRHERGDLLEIARPIVRRLARQSGETVVLAVQEGERLVLVDRSESDRAMRITAPLGMRLPIGAGCLGKVVLAYLPATRRESLLANGALRAFTPRSILDRDTYLGELESVRRSGVATDDEEYLVGVRAVGAPILDADRRLVAALAVVGMAASIDDRRMVELARAARLAALEISAGLGCDAPD